MPITARIPTRPARARSRSSGCTSWSARPAQSKDRTFQVEFLDPGLQAFAFTFG
ncbi:MAG: hypothetical protein WDN69_09050 [Aliidongia sp.]